MRCYICDKALSEPNFNTDHDDYEPCDECQAVILDTLKGYEDQAAAGEDEFAETPPTNDYYNAVQPDLYEEDEDV